MHKLIKRKVSNLLYRITHVMGNHIDDKVEIQSQTKVFKSKIIREVIIEKNCLIENSFLSGSTIKIGNNSYINNSEIKGDISTGSNCKIQKANIIGRIEIGAYSSLWGPNINISTAINFIKIGKYCSIANNVVIQEYNHNHQLFSTYFIEKNFLKNDQHKEEIISKGSIIIENDVWIGANCVVLSGSHISHGAVIAAGSVVNGFVPPYAIVGGVPARILKYRFAKETISKLLELKWWDWSEEKLKDELETLKSIVKHDMS